ncbi:MAG: ATP-dependent DNA helicase RecQ [Spirochaetales bacterium]|nr:ATP-dependent DNA helicase RecQ [Spirochaetales bacterium]
METEAIIQTEDPVVSCARERFSIPYLYPYQRCAIANILEGVHQIVILPTGGGKSLCYQLPSLLLEGPTLVIMPLLSLIADQKRSMGEKGIPAGVITGEQSMVERADIFKKAGEGSIPIILTTPEAALSSKIIKQLSRLAISHLVIDEAHCVSEWGESFRPSYLDLSRLIKHLRDPLVTAFTATAAETVIQKIKTILFSDTPVVTVMANPDRPNISYRVIPVLSRNHAITRLAKTENRPVIIFTRSRKGAERTARMLRQRMAEDGIFFYHAGLNREERKDVEEWFLRSENGILCSTSAYGMGVDKPDIRTVIHADIPPSVEAYLQESGRAGRDGGSAEAILLYGEEDIRFTGTITDEVRKKRFERILSYARNDSHCRRAYLLSLLDYTLDDLCSGCDVCHSDVVREYEGERLILAFFNRNKRRYTLREARQLLAGIKTYEVVQKNLDFAYGYGLLSEWHTDDIEEAIELLVTANKLYIPQRGFWKRRITIRSPMKNDRRS